MIQPQDPSLAAEVEAITSHKPLATGREIIYFSRVSKEYSVTLC